MSTWWILLRSIKDAVLCLLVLTPIGLYLFMAVALIASKKWYGIFGIFMLVFLACLAKNIGWLGPLR